MSLADSAATPAAMPVVQPGATLRSVSEEISDRVLQPQAPRWWWIGFGIALA